MEVVFEIVNRANRTLERHRANGEEISIGRAYDNDLILSDETVSPHHAVIESRADGDPVLIDLGSLNGIRAGEFGPVDGSTALRSGEEYSFGRALVRIYDIDHEVAQTTLIGGTDGIIRNVLIKQLFVPGSLRSAPSVPIVLH